MKRNNHVWLAVDVCQNMHVNCSTYFLLQVVLESLSISVGECSRKPRDDAFSRGLAAAILLGLAHVIATVLGGCKCIFITNKQNSQKPSANQLLGLSFMILSW